MAVPNVVPNGAEARVLFSIAGELAENTYGFQTAGSMSIDQTLADQVETAIKGAWNANLGPLCPPTTELLHVGLRDLRQANLPEHLGTSNPAAGTGIADPLPSQVALCLTLRTAGAGRSFRGRSYIGGFDEAQNDTNGEAATGAITAAISYVQSFQTSLNALGLSLAVLTHPQERIVETKTTYHADGTTTVKTMSEQTAKTGAANRVTLVEARDASWDTQRRRGNGRGTNSVAALRSPSGFRARF